MPEAELRLIQFFIGSNERNSNITAKIINFEFYMIISDFYWFFLIFSDFCEYFYWVDFLENEK